MNGGQIFSGRFFRQFPWQAPQTPQPPAAIGAELPDTHKATVTLGIGQDFVQGVMGLTNWGKPWENPDENGNFNTFSSGKC